MCLVLVFLILFSFGIVLAFCFLFVFIDFLFFVNLIGMDVLFSSFITLSSWGGGHCNPASTLGIMGLENHAMDPLGCWKPVK